MKAHFVLDLITFFLDANASSKAKRSPAMIVGLSSTLKQVWLTLPEGDLLSKSPLCHYWKEIKYIDRHERTQLVENARTLFLM